MQEKVLFNLWLPLMNKEIGDWNIFMDSWMAGFPLMTWYQQQLLMGLKVAWDELTVACCHQTFNLSCQTAFFQYCGLLPSLLLCPGYLHATWCKPLVFWQHPYWHLWICGTAVASNCRFSTNASGRGILSSIIDMSPILIVLFKWNMPLKVGASWYTGIHPLNYCCMHGIEHLLESSFLKVKSHV